MNKKYFVLGIIFILVMASSCYASGLSKEKLESKGGSEGDPSTPKEVTTNNKPDTTAPNTAGEEKKPVADISVEVVPGSKVKAEIKMDETTNTPKSITVDTGAGSTTITPGTEGKSTVVESDDQTILIGPEFPDLPVVVVQSPKSQDEVDKEVLYEVKSEAVLDLDEVKTELKAAQQAGDQDKVEDLSNEKQAIEDHLKEVQFKIDVIDKGPSAAKAVQEKEEKDIIIAAIKEQFNDPAILEQVKAKTNVEVLKIELDDFPLKDLKKIQEGVSELVKDKVAIDVTKELIGQSEGVGPKAQIAVIPIQLGIDNRNSKISIYENKIEITSTEKVVPVNFGGVVIATYERKEPETPLYLINDKYLKLANSENIGGWAGAVVLDVKTVVPVGATTTFILDSAVQKGIVSPGELTDLASKIPTPVSDAMGTAFSSQSNPELDAHHASKQPPSAQGIVLDNAFEKLNDPNFPNQGYSTPDNFPVPKEITPQYPSDPNDVEVGKTYLMPLNDPKMDPKWAENEPEQPKKSFRALLDIPKSLIGSVKTIFRRR